MTTKILSNMKNSFDEADELDGFEDLNDDDQEKIRKAWADGKVADEDVPDSARKADGEDNDEEDDEKPKAKKGGKKKADAEKDGDGGKGVFKLEYASSARAKCKSACPYRLYYTRNTHCSLTTDCGGTFDVSSQRVLPNWFMHI